MVSRIAAILCIAGALAPAAELDLTPLVHFSELEGARSEVTAFRNGENFVTWQPPHQWRLSGESRRLSLVPPDASQADAMIEVLARPPSPTFDAGFARALKEEVARALPREALNLEWAEDESDSILLNRHSTYKVTVSYTLFAQRYTKTIWICNFAEQQLRFHLTARAQDFGKLHEQFRESLYSWQGLK